MTRDRKIHRQEPESAYKICVQCGTPKLLEEFASRSGRSGGRRRRRGTCRDCRQLEPKSELPAAEADRSVVASEAEDKPKRRRRRRGKGKKVPPMVLPALIRNEAQAHKTKIDPQDASVLKPTRQGFIRMRGRTDNGRSWYHEIDLELAAILVRERAAVVVNPHTIRRLYSNKEFRRMIMTRDRNTCHYCGRYGDTLDHLLPRTKGGHTTPLNVVCACNECNQSKAALDVDEFIHKAGLSKR